MKPYYEHSGITIYHGDCRDVLPTVKADAVVSDPPYGIASWSANSSGGFMDAEEAAKIRAWDLSSPDRALLLSIASIGPTILWGGNYLDMPPSPRVLVWDKAQMGMHFAEVEVAWTNLSRGTSRLLRLPLKSQEVFGVNSEREHPTQKPIRLMEWCLSFVPEGIVLDPFMGSGTTLVACQKLGRHGIGIEIDKDYFEIACRRVEEAARRPDLFIPATQTPTQEVMDL